MKKFLAALLAVIMVLSMAACGDTTEPATTTAPKNDPTPTTPVVTDPIVTDPVVTEPVTPEALPENPLLYWDFESLDGLTSVEKFTDDAGAVSLVESAHSILTADGVVGKAVYLDGKYGIQLDMNNLDIADDSYTISFWIYAERLGDFMPIVQMGRNINSADTTLPTTWLNFTRGSWAETYPLAWNRNTSIPWATDENGVFPWIAHVTADTVMGKGEWCLVTLVVDGNRYTCLDDNGDRIGTRYYLNGELVFDASAEYLYYQGVAPELFTGSEVAGFIGINYWDSLYKGYVDELTVYDEALTSGQVLSLFQKGDTSVVPVAPVETEPEPEPTEPVLGDIVPDANAIDVLGTTARDLDWWTDNTAGYELTEGGTLTMKLNNYSNGALNWNNFVLAFTNTAVTTDKIAGAAEFPGYAEYCVVRADAFGWGDASYAAAFEMSWTDWVAWLELMKDAEVTVVMTRNGNTIVIDFTFTGADGTVMTEKGTITTSLTADAPCYVHVGGEGAYIELLSVE